MHPAQKRALPALASSPLYFTEPDAASGPGRCYCKVSLWYCWPRSCNIQDVVADESQKGRRTGIEELSWRTNDVLARIASLRAESGHHKTATSCPHNTVHHQQASHDTHIRLVA